MRKAFFLKFSTTVSFSIIATISTFLFGCQSISPTQSSNSNNFTQSKIGNDTEVVVKPQSGGSSVTANSSVSVGEGYVNDEINMEVEIDENFLKVEKKLEIRLY